MKKKTIRKATVTYTETHRIKLAPFACPCGRVAKASDIECLDNGELRLVCECGDEIFAFENRW
jgi:hypothetical protein